MCITYSFKHTVFALVVRHSDLVRNDFLVEDDNRVIKTSPCESHTGHHAPRSTHLLNRILVGRRDDDDKQPRVQQALFLGFDWIAQWAIGATRCDDECANTVLLETQRPHGVVRRCSGEAVTRDTRGVQVMMSHP